MTDDKIGRRWQKMRSKAKSCPNGCGSRLWLNHSLTNRWKPYWVECGDCHWCAKREPTIRLAVWAWNREVAYDP